jgi:hypothetical protein
MRLQPARIAGTGDMALDVDEVLYAEGETGERSCRGALQAKATMRAERTRGVLEVGGRGHSAA